MNKKQKKDLQFLMFVLFRSEIGRLGGEEFAREKCARSCSALLQSLVTAMPMEVFHSIVLINDLFNCEVCPEIFLPPELKVNYPHSESPLPITTSRNA